jgi:hypothetical protein
VEGRLNATYAMYYEGNESIPVGAEAGPPLTATWRISGSFLGGGSSKPIESQSPAFKVQFTERTIGRIQLECSIRNTGELAEQVLPPKEEGKETPPPGEAKLVFEVAGNCVEIEPVRGRRWAPFKFGAPFRPFCGYGTNTPPQTGETTPCPEDIARPPQLTPEQSLALGGETVAIQAPPGMLGDAPLEIDAEPLEEGSGTACVISGEIEADFNNADSTLELPETPGPLTKLTGSDCEEPVVSGDDTITLDEGGTLQLLAP